MFWTWIPLLAIVAGGCARGAGPAPNTAVKAWLQAASRDDPRAAYQLLAASLRRKLSEEEFTNRWRASAEERKTQATALGPLATRPPVERGRALWSDGRQAELVRDGGWRLTTPRIAAGGAPSPEEAVRRFAEALERHDLDGLLDLLADPLRSLVERELADRLTRLKTALNKEIQVDGKRARIRLDERFYLELRQEGGRWRVSDFN
jgi:hypothetical protein